MVRGWLAVNPPAGSGPRKSTRKTPGVATSAAWSVIYAWLVVLAAVWRSDPWNRPVMPSLMPVPRRLSVKLLLPAQIAEGASAVKVGRTHGAWFGADMK
jgi:hypothetical protein